MSESEPRDAALDHLRRTMRAGYVVRTLRFAAANLDDDAMLYEMAERVFETDWTTPPALCPLCEEATCDAACPLAGIR